MAFQPFSDPQDVTVQTSLRAPFRYREHLRHLAEQKGISLNQLILDAVMRVHPDPRRGGGVDE